MNLNQAIERHQAWKLKFRLAMHERAQMDCATIGCDHACEIGQWIEGEGARQHGALPAFVSLRTAHTAFHTLAGKIAELINAKKFDEASRQLNSLNYVQTSQRVTIAIVTLQSSLGRSDAA